MILSSVSRVVAVLGALLLAAHVLSGGSARASKARRREG